MNKSIPGSVVQESLRESSRIVERALSGRWLSRFEGLAAGSRTEVLMFKTYANHGDS